MAAEPVAPLLDVREEEEFKRDAVSVEKALSYAHPLASEEPIADQDEANRVADAVRGLANVRVSAKEHRLALTAPYRATTDAVNTDYAELLSPLEAAEAALKDRGLAWQKALEARAREEARRKAEEQEREAEAKALEAQEAAEAAAADPDDEEMRQFAEETREDAAAAAVAPPPRVNAPPRQSRGAFGKLGTRKVYRYEVIDAAMVPAELKVVDGGLVKARIKAEAQQAKESGQPFNVEIIPGIRIWPEDVAVSR